MVGYVATAFIRLGREIEQEGPTSPAMLSILLLSWPDFQKDISRPTSPAMLSILLLGWPDFQKDISLIGKVVYFVIRR